MYPEDRVLVGVMPDPYDFQIACEQHWYRVPAKHAPSGIHAEYVSFYFTAKFPDEMRWAIRYFARRTGHEMVTRSSLFPDQPNHPRAQDMYYKIQLGTVREKQPPILSLRWRRITFIQTTWDRFMKATEVNDLYRSNDEFVDRIYARLKESGIYVERLVEVGGQRKQLVDLVVPCKNGSLKLVGPDSKVTGAVRLAGNESSDMALIQNAVAARGGAMTVDSPL